MIQVNTKTLTATRSSIPQSLQGLSADTLRNLQTETNPVPDEFKDIEFWDEVDGTPPYDFNTHTFDGTETFTVNKVSKTVSVVRGVRAKTQEELDAMMIAKAKEAEQVVQTHINAKCRELGYDNENSIAKYLVDGNPFYTECKAISLWIGNVWIYAHQVQADVVAGTRTLPTSEELINELPKYGV